MQLKQILFVLLATGLLLAGPARGANVALFADTNYVGYNPGVTGDEASNLQASLESLGHTVTPFTGTTSSAWSSALAGADVLAIPEQENAAIYPALDAGARATILDFVSSGGGLVVSLDYNDFLNDLFGWSLSTVGGGPWDLVDANAVGTAFAGGPASLPNNDGTSAYVNLPGDASCMYANDNPSCVVLTAPHGSGRVVLLGWDWYDAQPTGSQDNGWIEVLDNAMEFLGGSGPTMRFEPQPIPALGSRGLGLLALALGLVAFGYLRRGKAA